MQINNTNLGNLYRGFNILYTDAMNATKPVSDPLSVEIPSTHKIEEYDWLNDVPGMKELKDEIEVSNLTANQWTIRNKKWSSMVNVDEEDIENDNLGLYNNKFAQMGEAATMHKDELNFGLLTSGFDETCYTGKTFFATNHKRDSKDTAFSNLLTVKLNAFSYMQARARLRSRLNSRGRPMNLGIKLALIVGTALEPVADSILKLDKVVQAVAGDGGAIVAAAQTDNVNKGTATTIVSPYLPDDVWFLAEIGKPIKPLIWQVNKKPVLIAQTSAAQSDYVFEKHKYRYQAYGRYNAGYALPELIVGSTGENAAPTEYP